MRYARLLYSNDRTIIATTKYTAELLIQPCIWLPKVVDPDERERLFNEHIARQRARALERERERERDAAHAAKRKERSRGGGDESSDDDRRRVSPHPQASNMTWIINLP